jgi:hypothetical protein
VGRSLAKLAALKKPLLSRFQANKKHDTAIPRGRVSFFVTWRLLLRANGDYGVRKPDAYHFTTGWHREFVNANLTTV